MRWWTRAFEWSKEAIMKNSLEQFLHRLKGNQQMIIGLVLLAVLMVIAIFGPLPAGQ